MLVAKQTYIASLSSMILIPGSRRDHTTCAAKYMTPVLSVPTAPGTGTREVFQARTLSTLSVASMVFPS